MTRPNKPSYRTPQAAERALSDLAKRTDWGSDHDHQTKRHALLHDRFLSRLFSNDELADRWLLKGGFGLLARTPDTRATRDLDIQTNDREFDAAYKDLRRAAQIDLGDQLTFRFVRASPHRGGDGNHGGVIQFACFADDKRVGVIKIDMAFNRRTPTGTIKTAHSKMLPPGSRFYSVPYRFFPTPDQIADKLCATRRDANPHQAESSRVKDLIHLVGMLKTETFSADELYRATRAEEVFRGLPPSTRFIIPTSWNELYLRESKSTLCQDFPNAAEAAEFVAACIDPVLDRSRSTGFWTPENTNWSGAVTTPTAPPVSATTAGDDTCGSTTQRDTQCLRRGVCPYHSR